MHSPTPTSLLAKKTPTTEVKSSGADPPAAMKVAPATSSDIFSLLVITWTKQFVMINTVFVYKYVLNVLGVYDTLLATSSDIFSLLVITWTKQFVMINTVFVYKYVLNILGVYDALICDIQWYLQSACYHLNELTCNNNQCICV